VRLRRRWFSPKKAGITTKRRCPPKKTPPKKRRSVPPKGDPLLGALKKKGKSFTLWGNIKGGKKKFPQRKEEIKKL